jgi:hypothetical protein
MNRTTILLVALVATASLLVSTGAFQPSGTDSIADANIEMRPADGPNGDYAGLNANGEIELLLSSANPAIEGESINPNAVTPIDRVFTIEYTGERYAEVWLTDDAEDVRYFRGDDPADTFEGRANNVTLEPGETVPVGLLVDTRGENDVESAETFTLHSRVAEPEDIESSENSVQSQSQSSSDGSPDTGETSDGTTGQQDGTPSLSIRSATLSGSTLSGSTVAPGETVTVTAVIENPTSTAVTADVDLLVDANTETTRTETIDAGDTREVVFEVAFDRSGTYDVSVRANAQSSDTDSTTVELETLVVEPPSSGSQPADSGPGTPASTETPGDTGPPANVSGSQTPEPSVNATNTNQLTPTQEATGFGFLPVLGLFVGLAALLVILGVWRRRSNEE